MQNDLDYLAEFIDDLPVGIARADTTGKLDNHFNKFLLEMFGWSPDDIDSMEKWFHKAYPDPAYRQEVMQLWQEMVQETEAENKAYSTPRAVRIACKNRSFKWCETRYYRKGHFIYGIFIDISQQKKAENQLRDQSLIDPLTQIYNRRYFNLEFIERWQLSQRGQTPISIIMCDIDNFKEINDRYGPPKGDEVLIHIARTIKDSLQRSTDFVVRYGGEEFVIVSYDSDQTATINLCKKIQKNLTQVKVKGINKTDGCSLSYGINSSIAQKEQSAKMFIDNADKALYQAKESGKNTIVVFEPPA